MNATTYYQKRLTMTQDQPHASTTDWTRGVLVGAVLGGLGWGLFAANTVGAGGDQAHLNAIIGPLLLIAAGVSLICLIAAGVMVATRTAARARLLRTGAVALVVAPAGGWLFLGMQYLQTLLFRG